MPQLDYAIKYKKNSGQALSVKDLKDKYLFGIEIEDQQGVAYPDSAYELYLQAAQQNLEQFLNVKFAKQVFEETIPFDRNLWESWGYIRCTYPVVCPLSLEGFLNTTKQATYPQEWLTAKKESDGQLYHRNIYVVPAGQNSTAISSTVVFSGTIPEIGYGFAREIPEYWTVKYVTGFDRIPFDIIDIVGKLASIKVLNVGGDLVIGAGIASSNISIDGLSQGIQTTQSAENSAYSARIRQYEKELKEQLPIIRQRYVGISWGAI